MTDSEGFYASFFKPQLFEKKEKPVVLQECRGQANALPYVVQVSEEGGALVI